MNEYTVIGVVVAAFIAAGVLSYFFTPPVKRFAHKVGAIDRSEGQPAHAQGAYPAAWRSCYFR